MTSDLSFGNDQVQREQFCYDCAEIMRIGIVSVIFVNQCPVFLFLTTISRVTEKVKGSLISSPFIRKT